MIQKFCDDLNLFLKNQFNYKRLPAYVFLKTISTNRKKVELYIRFKSENEIWQKDTLVLARIAFETKQKGNGRKLLCFLVNHAQKYDYQKIGIEQTNDASAKFALKYGFQNLSQNKHWIITVEDLRNNLIKYIDLTNIVQVPIT